MSKASVIIIGAGLGGLSTGIYAQMNGYLYDLLDGKYLTAELRRLHDEWPLWRPIVLVNYGVTRDFSNEPSITMLKSPSSMGAGFLASGCWVIRIFNYCPNCAPAGRPSCRL